MAEPRTREGRLLQQRLQMSGQSAREAARAIDISDTRLRHIINGYQPAGGGQRLEVTAPAATLARIAAHLGVTAPELVAAGRDDAAAVLSASRETSQRSSPDPRLSEASLDELLDEVAARRAPRLSVVRDEVDDAVAAHEEEGSIAGEQEQPDTP